VRTGPPPTTAYRPSWLWPASGLRLGVLGADGFIGSHVVRTGLAAGADVVAICVKDAWRLEDLRDLEIHSLAAPWWTADLSSIAPSVDALALLAYEPPPPGVDRLEHERTVNRDGAVRVAAACGRVIFASSADVYGPWHDQPVGEDEQPSPATPYSIAKLEAEELLRESISLRVSTVFGPGENGPRALPSFVRALTAGRPPVVRGNDVRDLVHVGDVAAAIVNAAQLSHPAVFNVGSGIGRSTVELLAAVQTVLNMEIEPHREHALRPPSRLVLDIAVVQRALGFQPRQDFDQGVREEVRWLTAHLGVDGDRSGVW
jgi:UDP-glucose 4-epimerase